MSDLHQTIINITTEIPFVFLEKLLKKKITDSGKIPDDAVIKKLVNLIKDGNDEKIEWRDDDSDEIINISITEEDINELDRKTQKFIKDELPNIIIKTAEEGGKKLLSTLNKSWNEQYIYEKIDQYAFSQRLELRWGESLKIFRMLLTICREIGEEKYEKTRRSRSKKNLHKNEVIHRLYGRACQTMSEIEHLLSGGFAEGALARWRTLHEINIVFEIISLNSNHIAERYLDHEIVENMRAHRIYEEHYAELGYKKPSAREITRLKKDYSEIIKKYGPDFKNEYGWATPLTNKNSPNFTDLEKLAGQARMRSHYKLASYMIHASVKGIKFNLGLLGEQDIVLSGSSNAGLEEAGQNSIITMGKIVLSLFNSKLNMDDMIKIQLISQLVSQGVSEFIKTSKLLYKEEFVI